MNPQKINFHTHTTFCDGNNTPQQMVQAAIEKHFDILGFSGHSMFPFARSWHIAPRDFKNYEAEILNLQEQYKNQIEIQLGYEADYFPGVTIPSKSNYIARGLNPQFLIGSVHYVVTKNGHYSVDNSVQKVQSNLIRLYGNGKDFSSVNGKKAVCEYFEAEREMLKKGDFEILGHCDLIRKRNGELHFFDEKDSWYQKEIKATAKEIAHAGVIVEVNTGAIARGAMDDFYPSEQFMQILFEKGVPVMINSDAHKAEDLDCAFERAVSQIKKIGWKEITYPTENTFKHTKI